MGKALKFGDRYALQYFIRAFDENETGLHTQAIIGVEVGCSLGTSEAPAFQ